MVMPLMLLKDLQVVCIPSVAGAEMLRTTQATLSSFTWISMRIKAGCRASNPTLCVSVTLTRFKGPLLQKYLR
jgi:hypothetical protein